MSAQSISHNEAYFSLVYCVGPRGEFGLKNGLPWPKISEDLKHFKQLTTDVVNEKRQNIVIMGRKTFESLTKPLSNRINIVVSRELAEQTKDERSCYTPGEPVLQLYYVRNLNKALEISYNLTLKGYTEKTFVIGGKRLIEEAWTHPHLEYIHETQLGVSDPNRLVADVCLDLKKEPKSSLINTDIPEVSVKVDGVEYSMTFYTLKIYHADSLAHPEYAYLDLCSRILGTGKPSDNRTDISTHYVWGEQIKIPMSTHGFPLLTTKRVSFCNVATELLWFLSGKTNTKVLSAQGNHIWDANTSREFLDKNGFSNYEEGETGTSYPFQWRHFGYEKRPNEQLELGQGGFDQIANVINLIREVKANPKHPAARRLVVSSWNPMDVHKCVLPPCHKGMIFNVDNDQLDIMVEMRSCDCILGLPYNIASYSLMTYMICHIVGLKPGILIVSIANTHLYNNGIDAIQKQLSRPPRDWPVLRLVDAPSNIDNFVVQNFRIESYIPHPTPVKVEMAK